MNILMNELVARYALLWISAERRAEAEASLMVSKDAALDGDESRSRTVLTGITGPPPTPDEIALATDRVWQVLKGEVRWSETTPGDKAVWRGRFRNVDRYLATQVLGDLPIDEKATAMAMAAGLRDAEPPPPPEPTDIEFLRPPPRLRGFRERLGYHYYDTVTLKPGSGQSMRLFGNTNVGDVFRSNMLMGGSLVHDSSFVILGWWVWTSTLDGMAWLSDRAVFRISIGTRPVTPATFARELFMGVPFVEPYSRPLIIQVRQNFDVLLDMRESPPSDLDPFDVMVFLDGLQTMNVS